MKNIPKDRCYEEIIKGKYLFLNVNISVWTMLSDIEKCRDRTGMYPGVEIRSDQRLVELIGERGLENIPVFSSEEFMNVFDSVGAKSFDDCVKVINLLHDTGAWEGNGRELIKEGTASLDEIITSREAIYR